jgi:hypothetical protein
VGARSPSVNLGPVLTTQGYDARDILGWMERGFTGQDPTGLLDIQTIHNQSGLMTGPSFGSAGVSAFSYILLV